MFIDHRGRLNVYNGTFDAHLSTLNPATGLWSTISVPELSIINNGTFGKITAFGDYVFVPDHDSGDGPAQGIVRINVQNGTWIRFAIPSNPNDASIDLNIGPDGLLYSLGGAGSPSGRFIEVYDPLTLEFVRSINLSHIVLGGNTTVRDAVVARNGGFWLNGLYSPAYLLDPSGAILETLPFSVSDSVVDFDRAEDGTLLQSCGDGRIYLYDALFGNPQYFDTIGGLYDAQTFACFVPTPGTKLVPRSFLVFRGTVTGGDYYGLWDSDDERMQILSGTVPFPTESPIQLIATAFSPIANPSEIRFKVEAMVNTPGLRQILELFNYQTGQWEQIGFWDGSASDSIVEVSIEVDPARFVHQSTNEMKARVRYSRVGSTIFLAWSASIDHLLWTVFP
jgi:hypothetical protein